MKLPYSEGTVFLVPLRNGGYARGVVARSGKEGKVLFGYFFGPRLPSAESADIGGLDPAKAILQIRFGDLGLINGEWRILGKVAQWNRSMWPMPDFVRRDLRGITKPMLVHHSDSDPNLTEYEHPIDDAAGLDDDSLYGYGAVEIKLTKLLEGNAKPVGSWHNN